jgi:hypothetical protein
VITLWFFKDLNILNVTFLFHLFVYTFLTNLSAKVKNFISYLKKILIWFIIWIILKKRINILEERDVYNSYNQIIFIGKS